MNAIVELDNRLRRAKKDAEECKERLTAQFWRNILRELLIDRGIDLEELLLP